MKFDKFLGRAPAVSHPETPARKKKGRPRKPAHLKHPRSKDLDKCGPDGRVLPQYRKTKIAGRRHPNAKAKVRKARHKRLYARNANKQAAWRKSLRRRYCQHRSLGRLAGKRHARDDWYQLTYADFLLIWETAPAIYVPDKGIVPAKLLINNPLVCRGDCTYMDRLDRTQPFTRENTKVFYRGKPL